MTDPLLTIDDATREFRASPKTIRRRLVAGEIQGAYKRPGSRGPEWVMPRGSLVAAGFVRRNGAPAPEVPADPEIQAGYWEQRALDAEAALEVARQGSRTDDAADPARRRSGVWLGVASAIILGVVAVLLVAGRTDGPSPTDDLDPSHVASRATLTAATAGDDAIGVVGRVPPSVLPPDRRFVLVDVDAIDADDPRYLVAVVAGDPPASWVAIRERADIVATVPVTEGLVELLDRGAAVPADGEETTEPDAGAQLDGDDDEAGLDAAEPVETAPEVGDEADAGGPAPADPDAAEPSTPSTPGPATDDETVAAPVPEPESGTAPRGGEPGTVEVATGDSFWTLAVALADGGDIAEVTAVWSALIDANLDRLVEPGNPDLLHVGQVLIVPSGAG